MVDYIVTNGVAVLEVNNPPVNALSGVVRDGIVHFLVKANADSAVKAIVVCGKGRTFPAGADIKEFATLRKQKSGHVLDTGRKAVMDVFDKSTKPIVAAIHGTSLGGGLEIALSAHYRIAVPSARFGLPESQLGIIPALGGTQRLPRLVGLEKAVDMVITGRHVNAKEALSMGLIDKIVDGDIKNEGIAFARTVASTPLTGRITSQRSVPDAANREAIISEAIKRTQKKYKGIMAPYACVRAVEASVTSKSFAEGFQQEQEISKQLFGSDQAKAMQYAFFGQRAASKWEIPGGPNYQSARPIPFKTGAVIGAGTMGSGIAMCMLNAGIPVILLEQNEKFLNRGVAALKYLYMGSVKLGRMTREEAQEAMSLLRPTTKYEDLKNVDFVVEAVFENMALKKEIFAKLDQVCPPHTILSSNTSSLDIDQMASATSRPEKVIGVHFFVPAYYMRLLEVVKGKRSSPETIATAFSYATKIGKVPILVGNCPSFVANRMLGKYTTEARFLVEEGALPHEVDAVFEDFGFPIGPFKVADLSGLDIGWNIKKELCKSKGIPYDPRALILDGSRTSPLGDILCEQGRLGRKTGRGWYKYAQPGAKVPIVDDEVTKIIENFCREYGIKRHKIEREEILERCIYPVINEGFKILEEGMASKPEDIDTIWLLGFSWPRQRGGPMYMASQKGLKEVYDKVCKYHQLLPNCPQWKPSALLRRLATTAPDTPVTEWRHHFSKL